MYVLIVAVLAFVLVAPAQAQVSIDIGIHLPAPPRLVVVPQVPAVQYVPTAPGNVFFYSNQYWAFANGGWYLSSGHGGPWIVVAPQFVPRSILLVPVQYYHAPPGHWKKWEQKRPPRWDDEWGRDWADKRAWKHDDDRSKGRGRDDDGSKGRGRGQGKK